MADSDFGLKPADYVYSQYKNDVEAALGLRPHIDVPIKALME
jgi:hypothetical protein